MNSSIGFPMPKSIVVDEATETPTYAKFTAQPFQRSAEANVRHDDVSEDGSRYGEPE